MAAVLTEQDWHVRYQIYQYFVANTRPPTVEELADHLSLSVDEIRQSYRRLNEGHTIFLEPGTDTLRMASPLSAVPTPYRVQVGERWYWANCAWDSLGIPALLKQDANIEAQIPLTNEIVRYSIRNGQLEAPEARIHFALPVRQWYDNLIET
jgi:hypothetical protein